MKYLNIKIIDKRIGEVFPLPQHATKGSAGIDLVACLPSPLEIKPNTTELIPSGIAIFIENPQYAGMIIPRSGLGHKKGLILGNSIGLIDSDYQGELMISCWNRSQDTHIIEPGTRIAQLVIVSVSQPEIRVHEPQSETSRGTKGFGSTGYHTQGEPS